MTPKYAIYTPRLDDEHPSHYHMTVPQRNLLNQIQKQVMGSESIAHEAEGI